MLCYLCARDCLTELGLEGVVFFFFFFFNFLFIELGGVIKRGSWCGLWHWCWGA